MRAKAKIPLCFFLHSVLSHSLFSIFKCLFVESEVCPLFFFLYHNYQCCSLTFYSLEYLARVNSTTILIVMLFTLYYNCKLFSCFFWPIKKREVFRNPAFPILIP